MKPIYEKKVEDWARRALCHRLGIQAKSRTKAMQWHDIVARVANLAPIDWQAYAQNQRHAFGNWPPED